MINCENTRASKSSPALKNAARRNGVQSPSATAFLSAPPWKRIETPWAEPAATAWWRGVQSSSSLTSRFTLALTSSWMTVVWFIRAAQCNAALPSHRPVRSALALPSNNARVTRGRFSLAAIINAVQPSIFTLSTSAPASSSALTTSVCPALAARWTAVAPSSSAADVSAPADNNTRAALKCPIEHARSNGVMSCTRASSVSLILSASRTFNSSRIQERAAPSPVADKICMRLQPGGVGSPRLHETGGILTVNWLPDSVMRPRHQFKSPESPTPAGGAEETATAGGGASSG
mmetsp:Transcript_64187/g.139709  ORF Transcript_64187/g.139709 Transcript_64187/m.139709 type:complete len:291 (-) Transcript_64187:15-887(-)